MGSSECKGPGQERGGWKRPQTPRRRRHASHHRRRIRRKRPQSPLDHSRGGYRSGRKGRPPSTTISNRSISPCHRMTAGHSPPTQTTTAMAQRTRSRCTLTEVSLSHLEKRNKMKKAKKLPNLPAVSKGVLCGSDPSAFSLKRTSSSTRCTMPSVCDRAFQSASFLFEDGRLGAMG